MKKYTLSVAFLVSLCFCILNTQAQNGVIGTFAGVNTTGFSGDGGPANLAQLDTPAYIASDCSRNIYLPAGNRIRKINSLGIITTIAGNGISGFSGDGGPASTAELMNSGAISVDNSGNIYFVDVCRVRKISTSGIITTIAGTGSPGYGGDNGPATLAKVNYPYGIASDNTGNVYLSDGNNNRIRKINSSGIISTIAGNGTAGYSGDGTAATSAMLKTPYGIVFDNSGNLLIADCGNNRIRKVSPFGIISTIAGNGIPGFSGDGRLATMAKLYYPVNVAVDKTGTIIIADRNNQRIRELNTADGKIATVAGAGYSSFSGDGGFACTAGFDIWGIAVDSSCNIYFADGHSRVRKIRQLAKIGLYMDENNNCIFDNGEHYISNPSTIQVDSNSITIDTFSATCGFYYNQLGNEGDIYKFKTISIPPNMFNSCPASGTILDTIRISYGNVKNFAFGCSTAGFDLGLTAMTNVTGVTDQSIDIYAINNSCIPANAVVTFNFSPKYNIPLTIFPPPASISGHTITWNLNSLSLTTDPTPKFLWFVGVATSPLTVGDTIQTHGVITPISGDMNTANNSILIIDTVKASCDPNEMLVTPSGYIPSGTQLTYTIGFENVGNDTAFNIFILDSLSDNVDSKSFRIIASSANMNTTMLHSGTHNILKFDFDNINLLDSSHHGQCDGMVKFTIKAKNGLPDGTTIFNHAGVYFDANGVVTTNTVENIIGLPNEVVNNRADKDIQIYPNPATNILNIKTNSSNYTAFFISNTIGQTILQQQISAAQTQINVSPLAPGLYYITLRGDNGNTVQKFVKL